MHKKKLFTASILLLCGAVLFALEPFPMLDRTRLEPQLLDPLLLEGRVDSTYRLGPGDFLQIFVENHNYAVQVGPDGMVTLDEIGPRQVAGLPFCEAQMLLIESLSTKYRKEYCFVSLARLKRFSLPVTGAVHNQTTIPVEGTARLSWAINASGGTTFQADDRNVMILRNGDTIVVDLFALSRRGDFQNDPLLQQGDRIFVPRIDHTAPQVGIRVADGTLHFVSHYPDWSAYDYLDLADQWENRGSADHIVVSYADGRSEIVLLKDASRLMLDPGDQLELGNSPEEVFVGGAVAAPGALPYRAGWKVVDYLKAAGVQVFAEDVRRVKVIRADKTVEKVESLQSPVKPGDFIRLDKSTLEYVKDWAGIFTAVVSVIYTIVLIDATTNR